MKKFFNAIVIHLSLLLVGSPLFAQGEFVTDWNLSLAAGSGATQIQFLTEAATGGLLTLGKKSPLAPVQAVVLFPLV